MSGGRARRPRGAAAGEPGDETAPGGPGDGRVAAGGLIPGEILPSGGPGDGTGGGAGDGTGRAAARTAPAAGDRVRLADTALLVEVTEDLCRPRGSAPEAEPGTGVTVASRAEEAPDTVVTGAVIVDHWGVVRADVGIGGGRIRAIGRAGDPDTTPGVHPALVVGPRTRIVAADGLLLTAGAVECHAGPLGPGAVPEAIAAGVTTLIGADPRPAGTAGAGRLARLLRELAPWPVNVALLGRGGTADEEALRGQLRAGAAGVRTDAGRPAPAIDTALRIADEAGVRAALDGGGALTGDALAAVGARTVHACHDPAACHGRPPGAAVLAGLAHVVPSSAGAGGPHTINTADAPAAGPGERRAAGRARRGARGGGRPWGAAVADLLHDIGALSFAGSTGRPGETVLRTWQTAHVNRVRRGALPGDGAADNLRARRYVAKYTICPAVAYGLDHEVGSVTAGKLADLVLWDPRFFGVRPYLVLKGGAVAWGPSGAAAPRVPGAPGGAGGATAVHFVAPAAVEAGLAERLAVRRRLVPVADVRGRGKAAMPLNDALPRIEAAPGGGVRVDGEPVPVAPAGTLPMTRRYFLF